MPEFPYLLRLTLALAASSSGTMTFPVPNTEKLHVNHIYFVSTGAFSITDIRSTRGYHYTNASPSNAILSTQIQDTRNAFNSLHQLDIPIDVEGGESLIIDLLDTSAAPNTIQLLLSGSKETGV